jgi:hypothetical protein
MPAEDKPMSAEDDILRRQFRELYPDSLRIRIRLLRISFAAILVIA